MWIIPRTFVNKILGHAQRALPRECVGVLSGQCRTITGWHPLTNLAQESTRFLADPGQQIRLTAQLRENGQEVLAIYHSHPNGPGVPSLLDMEMAYHPEVLYLIVSLATDGRLEINGFHLRQGQFFPQELTIQD